MTSYKKLSKKAKYQIDLAKRGSWGGLNPITRVSKNPKAYDRNKRKREEKDNG